MNDADAIQTIINDLDAAIAALKRKQPGPADCIGECAAAYDRCMASAGSDAEKAVCKAAYNKCIANC